ncbi:MFS transporter [Actinotalea sp. BY-33]|uniref:MFS transporter n=1 Tax=Actinotalea soli TaxID=2819234 RepID=A0A939LQZ0_9CELL|nr:MFS transporter [Actinotalea soli]MBO1752383.1 MFS transporter [Actinotalea soli]
MSVLRARRASRPTSRDARVAPEVLRARRLLLGLYVLLGLTVSSWLSRLPSVRDQLDLTTSDLGVILLIGAVGSLTMVLVAGAIVVRWGSRRTMLVAAVLFSLATLALGLGPTLGSVAVLVAGIVLMSASFALGNVPMNVETAVIERRMGRTVVPQFHAAFSIGSVVGSGIGALAAWGQVPLLIQFGVVSVASLVWRFRAVPGAVLPLPPEPVSAAQAGDAGPRRRGAGMRRSLGAWREKRTLLIGLVVMTAALSEGSANNWLAIAVVDGFAQSEAVAALVFGVFVASMTVARLVGTRLIDRFGRVRVLLGSGVVSFAGLALFGTAPSLPLALLGVVGWGLGAGLAVPIGMVAVSEDPMRAAGRVAVVSAFASVASLAAPPLLGLAAESLGTRQALLLILGAMVVSIVLSGQVRSTAPAAVPRGVRPTGGPDAGSVPAPSASVTGDDLLVEVVVPDTLAGLGEAERVPSEVGR